MRKLLNFDYSCIHGTYWMYFGVSNSFASVFLLARGYSNSEIGIILAAANILAVVLQPLIADLADRTRRISIIGISEIITALIMLLTFGLFVFTEKTTALAVIFVLLIAWVLVLQPFFNSLTFTLEECGISVNFGVARSMGSLAYSILVAILGTLVEKYSVGVLPAAGEITLAMLVLSLYMTKRHYGRAKNAHRADCANHAASANHAKHADCEIPPEKTADSDESENINLIEFIRGNKLFFIINIGVIGLYFSNSVLNNYMLQIVSAVGGSSEDMGRILAIMAFLEIPTMVCFDFLRKKFSCRLMLQIASVGFTVKIFLCCIAKSVAMLLAAQIFQLAAFALFLPAMVHFTNEIMRKGEAVKGQALFTTMTTITTVFSSLAGGVILDISGAKMLTVTATAATAAGAVIIICALRAFKKAGE